MPSPILIAGIDSSTQSCKVVIRDHASGALVRQGRAAHPPGTEVDPEQWWSALQAAVAAAGGLDDVATVSIAGQQHGLVALDAAGAVIRPALLWNDTRSAAAALDLLGEVGADAYARRTGTVPVASFTATKLRWLRDAEPGNAARVAAVALPHDWLTWRLRGFGPGSPLEELTTDRSDASGTAYWNPESGAYDLELFERALGRTAREAGSGGSDHVVLPRVLGPSERAGLTPTGTVVAAGAGDNAGAALGLDARDGDVVVSIGTSGTVFTTTPVRPVDASGAVAGFADAAGHYLPLVATMNAALVLQTLAGLLDVDHHGLAELARKASPGSNGVVLLPYFAGERTPNLPDATASLHGLTLGNTTRSNLARAGIEGMLCGLEAGLEALRAVGVRERRVLLIGGAAQNSAVQEVAAQVFDAAITVPAPGEYVADGAAVQAAWALTGERPTWPVPVLAERAADHRPEIIAQYRSVAG